MQALTKQEVWEAMQFFNLRLANSSQKSREELAVLSAALHDDLVEERWTSERFALACRKHRKLSSFLPTTADLMAADKAVAESGPIQEFTALPAWETDVDAQAARNIAGARRILDALCRGKRLQ